MTLNPGELNLTSPGQVPISVMPVEAFISTADHSPPTYPVWSMADYFNRAFCES